MGSKYCTGCKQGYPLINFAKDAHRKDGKSHYCKQCISKRRIEYRSARREHMRVLERKHYLKKTFGITIEEYDALDHKQGRLCAICKAPHQKGKRHAVDHDHKTGKIRGLLCFKCNTSLGQFYSIELLTNAIKYINDNQ